MVEVNYLAVVVAGIAAMAIGAFWYSPVAFGKQWMKLMGLTKKDMGKAAKKSMNQGYLLGLLSQIVTAYVLAHILVFAMAYTGQEGWAAGASTGFWVWIGFQATQMLGSVLWEMKPWKLYILNIAYQLVSLMVMGIILALWV